MVSLCWGLSFLLNVPNKPSTVLHASCPVFVRVCMKYRLPLLRQFLIFGTFLHYLSYNGDENVCHLHFKGFIALCIVLCCSMEGRMV